MAVIEQPATLTVTDKAGNIYVLLPYTDVSRVAGAVASVNGQQPDDDGDVLAGITLNIY